MRQISTENYGPLSRQLLGLAAASNLPRTLVFSQPDAAAEPLLRTMTDQSVSKNRRVRMPHDAQALQAGLWLLFDFMKESHDISQQIGTPSGSYWHGILHRREPDAFNAKYWMARVGEHPVFPELLGDAREIAASALDTSSVETAARLAGMKSWDAAWFTDRCCAEIEAAEQQLLLDIQRREWALLFDYNFTKAFA